ncbi:MAG: hypothetical protein ABEJ76_06150 [Halanaeroarchaeum sp.]
MNCIVCGREAGYHRAVVDTLEDDLVGAICRECEHEEFGRSLERGFFDRREGCVLCERDGHVAIPVWRPTARRTPDGDVINEVAYQVDDATVRLCDEHVTMLAGEYPGERAAAATTGHR